jgi:hypothetical protein
MVVIRVCGFARYFNKCNTRDKKMSMIAYECSLRVQWIIFK